MEKEGLPMHVSLTPKREELVRQKVESGLYNNASEVNREALRIMAEHDEVYQLKFKNLRDALAAGETDVAAVHMVEISGDKELNEFFARL
jgi:antitoxin ParD1/3/4